MATLSINMTAKSIPNSNNGCVFMVPDSFAYGFGSTAPTEWIIGQASNPIDYGGAYGLVWVKKITNDVSIDLTYFGV